LLPLTLPFPLTLPLCTLPVFAFPTLLPGLPLCCLATAPTVSSLPSPCSCCRVVVVYEVSSIAGGGSPAVQRLLTGPLQSDALQGGSLTLHLDLPQGECGTNTANS
jgi:hypothetical protein